MINVSEKVKSYLVKYPTLKDNDLKLIATIWLDEFKALGFSEDEAKKFLKPISEGKLTKSGSIIRNRAQLQERDPEMRGTGYNERMKLQKPVQEDLGYNV